jgi:hypothetical protein
LKKAFSIIIFFIASSIGTFALELPLSTGLGVLLDYSYSSISADHKDLGLSGSLSYSSFNYGLFTYFDMRYLEAGLGFAGISTSIKTDEAISSKDGNNGIDPENIKLTGNALILLLYGKFPFDFDGFSVYPLIGIEGQIVLSMLYGEDSPAGWERKKEGDSYLGTAGNWSSFWFRAGVGFDFFVGDSFFIRTELTFGIKAPNPREMTITRNLSNSGTYDNISAYSIGPKLRLAIGYVFTTVDIFSGLGGSYSGGGSRGGGGGGWSDSDIYYPR